MKQSRVIQRVALIWKQPEKQTKKIGLTSLQRKYLHAKDIIHQIVLRTLLWLPH